ncbi:MAG: substrate-binding domain-containing protein [Atribacterota bacterium]|nr:substrate-binding domain-containing protein [Candidatus Atribacteria bacterium]MDD3538984.1 substrate-binding domain-containing protein [Atribacterota bacterium]MDD5497159.1 substrate-binding domain-containing protein [Atribacterota bacterium]
MNKYFLNKIILALAIVTIFTGLVFAAPVNLKLATTTSTENSGLLGILLPPFEERYNIKVDVIAVGTGAAIQLGENGDVDVVLVHARAAEDKMVEEGYGVNRRDVMHNDFIIVGPPDDPAGIKGEKDAALALTKIANSEKQVFFVSRGDKSGTHIKELELWQSAGIEPQGEWYLEIGQGMEAALLVADERQGYVLADRGTYLATKDKIELVILSEGDPRLFNPYGIIAVNPAVHPHVKYMEAMQLIAWMTSLEGQKIIGEYKQHGEVLFFPDAIPLSK